MTILLFFVMSLTVASGCSVLTSSADKAVSSDAKAEPSSQPASPLSPAASPEPQSTPSAPSSREPEPSETSELVPYDGVVEHIFFHPLIVYPQLAFDKDSLSDGYNEWFTTIPEFNKMMDALYADDFILVHLEDVYEEQTSGSGTKIAKKTLMLPKGKKPLVISIDDLNYYDYMIKNGNAFKLVLDADGDAATYSVTPEGIEVVSRDNDVIPLLDRFVEAHPDFSLNGAKGVIALTGFQGILGYRTQRDSPDRETEKTEVRPIIERLKETGWTFGSHSYGHINLSKVSLDRLKKDTEEWKDEVEPLVGATALFFYPHGARVEYGSPKFNFLVASGYRVISAVGPTSYTKVIDGAYTMDRRHMDGIALIQQPKTLKDLFDPAEVLDTVNRPAEYWKQHS
ncbi:hypothetical protein D7Z26_06925 [Cohnella endophytica]|uniref:NodB homology domain-containing protein n=1 Tax=Cohnella endophytica TaxID=2419778 RepID=A0A494Y3V6_9BACL|nr:polysaccharide deacetylase family protein [Cohnella endophytica]RKP54966.1 hypothetical protein D7Z26_06925 [Cohnella endophytica]